MAEEWTLGQLLGELVERNGVTPTEVEQSAAMARRILARGDTVVVYANAELGTIDCGQLFVTSYGSPAAQLERTDYPEPPQRCPDIGAMVMWRFTLAAVVLP